MATAALSIRSLLKAAWTGIVERKKLVERALRF
jgi:hypothetical protein